MIHLNLRSRSVRVVFLYGLLLLLLVPLLLSQGGNPPVSPAVTAESVRAGKDVFFEYCSGCHGRRADGRGPQSLNLVPKPQNLRNAQFVKYLTDERMYSSLSGGVRGTSMPAFEFTLSPERRWQVIHYLRSLTADDTVRVANAPEYQPVAPDTKNPVEPAPGSVEQGRRAFDNYCASCHGARGDGKGLIAASLTPAPRNLVIITSWGEKPFMDYLPDGRVYDSITNGVPGTSMAPWIKVLDDTERWNVVNYLRSAADREHKRVETSYQ